VAAVIGLVLALLRGGAAAHRDCARYREDAERYYTSAEQRGSSIGMAGDAAMAATALAFARDCEGR
jgi:hypothetical protein